MRSGNAKVTPAMAYRRRRRFLIGNLPGQQVLTVGEWVSTGVGKRDDPEGDTAEMARLGW